MQRAPLALVLPLLVVSFSAAATPSTCNQMGLGQGAGLDGFIPFPTTDPWRADITHAPVSSFSAGVIHLLAPVGLHPDFASGTDNGSTIGIPYNIVSHARPVKVSYKAYGAQSDPGPMPIPADTRVEGYPAPGPGDDRHIIVLDHDRCFLYELYNAEVQGDGSWKADSGAVWDLLSNSERPFGWTSADAAGLPVFPGLVRYDEVAAGAINHALRFTVKQSRPGFVSPATHQAPNVSNPPAAVLGMRFRLKSSFDISNYPPQARVVLAALKKYGMIIADNGSNMYISGAPDDRWNNDDLRTLNKVIAADFEVVNGPAAPATETGLPVISSFTISATDLAANGEAVLRWSASNASTVIIEPEIGPVRGNVMAIHPTASTTYTVYATNHLGRVAKQVKVTVVK